MEENILEVKKWKILTKEMRKVLKENVATICKKCESTWRDSLVVWDINVFKKIVPDIKKGESFYLAQCNRCSTSIKFL